MYSTDNEDITSILDMKKEFQRAFPPTSVLKRSLVSCLDAENSSFYVENSPQPASVQVYKEKAKQEKYKQMELIEARALATKLEKDLTSLQAKHRETCVGYEQELRGMSQKYDAGRQTVIDVKEQLNKLLTKDVELREELNKTRAELTRTSGEYEQKLLTLQKEKYKLQMKIQEIEQQAHARQQELRTENIRKESELNICRLDLNETKEQLQQAIKRYNTTFAQLQEAEEAKLNGIKAEQRVKQLELKLSQLDTEQTVVRTMKEQLGRLKSLESENRRLKSENYYCKETQDNVFLLREENCALKSRLERTEEKCMEFAKLETENQELKNELEKWRAIQDCNTKRSLSPQELKRRMRDLQHSNTSLLERQGILQASVHSLEERLKGKEQQLDELQAKLIREQTRAKEAEQLITRLRRKLMLVSKERDGYKGMLESYEKEASAGKLPTSQLNIKQLQDTVRNYQNHVTSMETELEQKSKELALAVSSTKTLEAELNKLKQMKPPNSNEADGKVMAQLREQVATLEKSLEELQVEKEEMQLRLDRAHMQGVYEPEKTKVITMIKNPFTMARKRQREEVEKLVEDNKRLKTRLQLVEENHGDLEDITQKVSLKLQESGVDSQQIKEFQEQIRSAELKNQRLMEVFKKKSHELREIFYCLLGYMIQLPTDNQYKLLSVYAQSSDDVLMFQKTESGEIQLLETAYSSTLSDKMEIYLTNGNSIPAFLSSLTLDLFNQQTMLQ